MPSGTTETRNRSAGGNLQVRLVKPESHDFARLAEFHAAMGVTGIGPDWWESIGRAHWQRKNPSVYRVYERAGRLVGFLGLAPLTPRTVADLRAGRRSL